MPTVCTDASKLIPTYLDGELSESELLAYEHHLAECGDCSAEVEAEREFIDRLRHALVSEPAPDTLKARLGRALDGEDEDKARRARRQRWAWVLPGGATLAAAAALLVFAFDVASPASNSNHSDEVAATSATPRPGPSLQVGVANRTEIDRSAREFLRMPVRAPRFANTGARLRGWRPLKSGSHSAALFLYEVTSRTGIHRLDVQTLDARNLDFSRAERRVVRGSEVWIARGFGTSDVVYRDENQIAYVFSSHMDTEELVNLVVQSDIVEQITRELSDR